MCRTGGAAHMIHYLIPNSEYKIEWPFGPQIILVKGHTFYVCLYGNKMSKN